MKTMNLYQGSLEYYMLEDEEKVDDTLNVYLRIKQSTRPLDSTLYRIEQNILITRIPEDSLAPRNQADRKKINQILYKKFYFTGIFDADATQVDIFNYVVKKKLLSFINGKNSTLLAYGASGAGKTFTMVGTADQPGIIPRSLDYLFRTIGNGGKPTVQPYQNNNILLLTESEINRNINNLEAILQNPHTVHETDVHIRTYRQMQQRLSTLSVGTVTTFPPIREVWVSFAEIYNENIYDLLEPGRGSQRPKLQIGGLQEDCYIKGLKHIYVRSGLEAYQVMQYGLHNLSYAATAVNSHSSRSHCIFSIRLIAGTDENNYKMSVFNFCDLAGAERVKKTLNNGDRLKESTKINSSLSVLSRCIQSIRNRQRKNLNISAPFRESKLTQLFQKGLKGNEDISMIVNINPSPDVFHETQHALIFSAIAKEITQDIIEETKNGCGEQTNGDFDTSDLLLQISELKNEIQEVYNDKAELVLQNSELEQQQEEMEMQILELKEIIENSEHVNECVSNGLCIIQHYVCDGKPDCKDGSDESLETCNGDPCRDKIPCDDGRCIPTAWCCDRHHDLNCTVTNRPRCCLGQSDSYEEMELGFPTQSQTQHTARYLFILVCVVSILFSVILLLLIISKVVMFAKKAALQQQQARVCENIALRNQTNINVIPCSLYTYRSASSRTPRSGNIVRNIIIDSSDVNDPLLFNPARFNVINASSAFDQPPSYVDVLQNNRLAAEPPPPYRSQDRINVSSLHTNERD
ncbi:kinesin-like protein subito isoform X2 [Anthonomus grandis grandis]|uniref:kinesin-like protein subito isoform X2 n=1 Tax=Anthonomus grandis grandis TaxID=2921223 RepID=UPI0021655442|nr:kinesin-like protein subito isoform X2 [Anthonomus grandis grandis]